MDTPTFLAPDVIFCDLCDNPAVRFFNACQTNLCLDCVNRHRDEFESLSHDIVTFKSKTKQLLLPQCKFHPGHRCQVYCQQCRTPICVLCFIETHKGHDVVEFAKTDEFEEEIVKNKVEENAANINSKYQKKDDGIKAEITPIATISTDYDLLRRVVCVGLGEAWVIGDNKFIKRIDTRGSVQETVATTNDTWPDDISVTKQGEVIYSENSSRTVKIVRQGKIETFITTPQGWSPGGLCCTHSGDILVNVNNGKKNKILRYEELEITQEIENDENGKPIFEEGSYMFPLCLTENNNGDICVSDLTADTVVVVTRTGRVRFRYNGTAAKRKAPFSPRSIVTDSRSQIIVADCNNDCLHILDQSGNLLRCVDSCELDKPGGLSVDKPGGLSVDKPGGLSVDREGMLWVALSKAKKIKIIHYLK